MSQTNLTLVSTWDDNGLQVDSTNTAWLSYPFTNSDGWPNLYPDEGSLRFWFLPDWISTNIDGGTGPGVWGRLIDAGQWTSNASYGWWSLYFDPAGCNIYFSAQTNNGTETNYFYAPISWDNSTWHEIELTYSSSNTALYIDGALATNGPGVTVLPPPEALTNGFSIGSDFGTGMQQAHGQFDDLWTFAGAENQTNVIASEYTEWAPIANPPLLFFASDDPTPPGDGGTNSGGGGSSNFTSPSYGSNDFWLQILPPGTNVYNTSSNSLTLILHGTTNDTAYQIWTTTNLAPPINWTQQQIFPGATNTNYTIFVFPVSSGPAIFFTAVNYSQDSDGDGLPDWWEMKYSTTSFPLSATNADTGNTGIPDGYKQDAAGDGYNNLEKYQMGIPPNVFVTPPAPNNFSAVLNTNGQIAFSWSLAPNLPAYGAGAVTGYTLTIADADDGFITNIIFGATQSNYVFAPDPVTEAYLSSGNSSPYISLQTDYANTNSAIAAPGPFNYKYTVETYIVRGPQGRLNLIAPNIPPGVQAIRVYVDEIFGTSYPKEASFMQPAQYLTNNPAYSPSYAYAFDVPVSGFTNGIYVIPYSQIPIYLSSFQYTTGAVANDGSVGPPPPDKFWAEFVIPISNIPYLDGRTNLQQNLAFLLQAANSAYPFSSYAINSSGAWAFSAPPGSNYVSAGFYVDTVYQYSSWGPGYAVNLDEFQPFEDNYFYRNFVVTANNINPDGSLKTGVYDSGGIAYPGYVATNLPSFMFDTYAFCTDGETNAPQGILTNWQWTYFNNFNLGDIGVAFNNSTQQLFLPNNESNLYGLPLASVEVADFTNGNLTIENLTTGNPITTHNNHSYYLFPQTASPELVTTGYYFGRPGIDPIPGDGTFATTNTTPLMISGVGGQFGFGYPLQITAWAKQAIVNGDPTMFAYLEQYFDQALLCDTNGNVTTNSAGILSEYGEFFPMYPGEVALVTKPDITTGQRGTNFIHVIGLQLDANHDGTMNPSFTGPDSTSPARPFQFWVNNNFDRNVMDADDNAPYDDDVESNDDAATCPGNPNVYTPDFNFLDGGSNRVPSSVRDLQDFARLWVTGVSSNLLANLPAGSTVTLNWGDVGFPNPATPTIDIFKAADADGGIGYLTNSDTAIKQCLTVFGPYIGRLGPGQSIQLNASQFSNSWAGDHYIWCGVSNGSGALTLTITDSNNNWLGQSIAYIKIQDIKQMYERWTVGDSPSLLPTTNAIPADDNYSPGVPAVPFLYGSSTDTNTPYILFVHGWNMKLFEKDRFAESAFKRLYWQGYQGRFGVFRWPTDYGFKGWATIATNPNEKNNYDRSEYQAWMSGAGLLNKLTWLNTRYPGKVYMLAHSMGNVVAGEALRLAGTNRIVNTYVASQAAISAHTYDTNVTNYSFSYPPLVLNPTTPNIYGGWFATNDGGGVRQLISFYNPNDYALQRSVWQLNQLLKPDALARFNNEMVNYGYSGGTNDPPPWNKFYKVYSSGAPIINLDIVNVLTNRYEAMALAAQSWTTPLGDTPVSTLDASINLTNMWPPDTTGNNYSAHFWHSAEFRGDYWEMLSYWHFLLGPNGFDIQ